MENDEAVEKLVVFVADALQRGVSIGKLQLAFAMMQPKDVPVEPVLILVAGTQLYEQRKNAPPKKTLIKRIQ